MARPWSTLASAASAIARTMARDAYTRTTRPSGSSTSSSPRPAGIRSCSSSRTRPRSGSNPSPIVATRKSGSAGSATMGGRTPTDGSKVPSGHSTAMRSRSPSTSEASVRTCSFSSRIESRSPADSTCTKKTRRPGGPIGPMASHSGSSTSKAPPSIRTQASAGGTSSASDPVSFAFTSVAPKRPTSKIVTDAGETCTRWNRSRCMPV